jgi:hypothetical protein
LSDEYNGWTNWETWLVNLHYEEILRELVKDFGLTTGQSLKETFLSVIKDDLNSNNMFISDLINGSIGSVNWWELLNHYQDEDEDED